MTFIHRMVKHRPRRMRPSLVQDLSALALASSYWYGISGGIGSQDTHGLTSLETRIDGSLRHARNIRDRSFRFGSMCNASFSMLALFHCN